MYLQICPRETDVIQHRVKLKDNTPIRCKPYPLPYAKREELWNDDEPMMMAEEPVLSIQWQEIPVQD